MIKVDHEAVKYFNIKQLEFHLVQAGTTQSSFLTTQVFLSPSHLNHHLKSEDSSKHIVQIFENL